MGKKPIVIIPIVECLTLETMLMQPVSIASLIKKLEKLAIRHGRTALLNFDAGYNNICIQVVKKTTKNTP